MASATDASFPQISSEAASGSDATLRGARVSVSAQSVRRGVLAVVILGLAVLIAVMYAAGVRKNTHINELRQHGIAIDVTVIGCHGLLGGSGSNAAGYTCRGTYAVSGHRYTETIPGSTLRSGTLRAVVDPKDPRVLSTPDAVASKRASAGVFVAPT